MKRISPAILAATLLFAGCGGGSSSSPSPDASNEDSQVLVDAGEDAPTPEDVLTPDTDSPDVADDTDPDTPPVPTPSGKLGTDVLEVLRTLQAHHLALGGEGVPQFIVGDFGDVDTSDDATVGQNLSQVVTTVSPAFRLTPGQLTFRHVTRDPMGFSHARFDQTRDSIPVVGGDFVFHVDPTGTVYAVNGVSYAHERAIPTDPTHTADEAAAVVATAYDGSSVTFSDTSLTYVISSDNLRSHLAWSIDVIGSRAASGGDILVDETIFVDAHDLSVVDTHPRVFVIKQQAIYDAENTENVDGHTLLGTSADELPESDDAVWYAWENGSDAYDCYADLFGRDSFDNQGHSLDTTVHFGTEYNNAFWYSTMNRMYYGDGDGTTFSTLAGSFDVMVHELSHAVTSHSGDLIYSNESGALNEAFSDIMAATCEAWKAGEIDDKTWKIGEDIYTPAEAGDALRYMDNPTADGHSYDYYPERYTGTEDNGGVHLNSGIANLAFVLLAQGGSHPRGVTSIDVSPIGVEMAAQVFYRAMTTYLTPSASFSAARAATALAAEDLYGEAIADQVNAAWSAVGVEAAPVLPPIPDEVDVLNPSQTVSDLAGAAGDSIVFSFEVPDESTDLSFVMAGGTGDADLYVRFGALPTQTEFDYRPYIYGNDEVVSPTNAIPGTWYVMVHGYSEFAGVALTATYEGVNVPPASETNCHDGVDNDDDGSTDCDDSECAEWPDCVQPNAIEPGDLVFTEIMANPASGEGDPRHEWFEVYNTTGAAIDMLGLEVSDRDGATPKVHTIAESVVVEAGAYAVFAYSAGDDLGFTPAYIYGATRIVLANTGDDIVLRRADGTIIDEVFYGIDGFPGVVSGVSLSASVEDMTTNDDGANWCRSAASAFNATGEVGTPGEGGGCGAEDPIPPADGALAITEILYDSAGAEPASEWFEVLALQGPLQLQGVVLASGTRTFTVEQSLVMVADERLVFCRSAADGPAGCIEYGSLQLANGGSVLSITGADGVVLDTVEYDDAWPWPTDGPGRSIELSENHLNVGDNDAGQLWCAAETAGAVDMGTPGAANVCAIVLETQVARRPVPGEAVITQIHYNSVGTEPYGEWFEVYLEALDDAQLFDVQGVTLATSSTQIVIESALVLPTGSYVVGCRDKDYGPPDCLEYHTLRFLNTGDTFSILNAAGEVMDEVQYGVGGEWPPSENGVSIELSQQEMAPEQNGIGAAWCSGENPYTAESLGTPNAENSCGYIEPQGPAPGDLVITEVLYNPSGAEPNAEWFEVLNVGPAPVILDGVQVISGTDTAAVTTTEILRIGDRAVFCRDIAVGPAGCILYASVRLNNTPDDLALLAADGTPLDDVSYDVATPWPVGQDGVAIELSENHLDPTSNDDGASWCSAVSGDTDLGTPGQSNDCAL